ncbi:MAG: hypothetical protein AD742_14600 [Methylibium sp. NZG]|nr:MAG: hypothetical protein AD742_14600 [Methylibium sp. NZG]
MHSHLVALVAAVGLIGASAPLPAQTPDGLPQLSSPIGSKSTAPADSKANRAGKDAKPAPDASFREITWDELVPKDWDPMKDFKGMSLGGLSDADPRAAALLKRMREAWDNAPGNNAIDGQAVRLPGYLVPLEDGKEGMSEFLLVPYFGACIHTPPPPSNQIVHVKPQQPPKGFRSMDTVWISGTLKLLRSDTMMGTSSYRMEAVRVETYVSKPR